MTTISELAASLGGVLGWICIVILPGLWITFGLRLGEISILDPGFDRDGTFSAYGLCPVLRDPIVRSLV